MRIALFGKTGQVATELQRRAGDAFVVQAIGRAEADFLKPDAVARVAEGVEADIIINAAAFTAVDKAETEIAAATAVNHHSVAALAGVASRRGIPLIHISTDYVFDGSGTKPRPPSAQTGPLGVYGASKLAGEDSIRANSGAFTILRTSWVFSAHGNNFVKTMLRLAAQRNDLSIVSDQIGGPTSAASIADALLNVARSMCEGAEGGIYHFAGSPDVSWSDFAREIFHRSSLNIAVEDIPTSEYPTPALRPQNSRLDCESLWRDFAIPRPDWRKDLTNVLRELGAI